jgi:hypothetical protein
MPTNYERAFAERPDVYAAWQQLTLDALGVRADASFNQLDGDVREALVVGRPIAAT